MIVVETIGIVTAIILLLSILAKRVHESSCDCARGRGIHVWLRNFSNSSLDDDETDE